MRLSIAQAGLLMEGNRIGFGIDEEEEEERSKSLKQSGDVIDKLPTLRPKAMPHLSVFSHIKASSSEMQCLQQRVEALNLAYHSFCGTRYNGRSMSIGTNEAWL